MCSLTRKDLQNFCLKEKLVNGILNMKMDIYMQIAQQAPFYLSIQTRKNQQI